MKNYFANTLGEYEEKVMQMTDKYTYGLNSSIELLNFYRKYHKCMFSWSEDRLLSEMEICDGIKTLTTSGICQTYLYNNFSKFDFVKKIAISLSIHIGEQSEFQNFLTNEFILHPKLTPPNYKPIQLNLNSINEYKVYDMGVELKKTVIARLKKPYFTNCKDYDNSNQGDCFNECFLKNYLGNLNCLPTENRFSTIFLNSIDNDDKYKFCPFNISNNITQFENLLQEKCNSLCKTPCLEIIYHISLEKKELSDDFWEMDIYFEEKFHRYIKYVPEIGPMEFIIKMLNLWNFWQGTYFIQILIIFKLFVDKFKNSLKINIRTKFSEILKKFILAVLTCLFIHNFFSSTMKFLRFETITTINLLDYEDDNNYPYFSILFEHYLPHFSANYFHSQMYLLKNNNIQKYYNLFSGLINKNYPDFVRTEFPETKITTFELAEFWLGYFNISKYHLFNFERFKMLYLNLNHSSLAKYPLIKDKLSLSFIFEDMP